MVPKRTADDAQFNDAYTPSTNQVINRQPQGATMNPSSAEQASAQFHPVNQQPPLQLPGPIGGSAMPVNQQRPLQLPGPIGGSAIPPAPASAPAPAPAPVEEEAPARKTKVARTTGEAKAKAKARAKTSTRVNKQSQASKNSERYRQTYLRGTQAASGAGSAELTGSEQDPIDLDAKEEVEEEEDEETQEDEEELGEEEEDVEEDEDKDEEEEEDEDEDEEEEEEEEEEEGEEGSNKKKKTNKTKKAKTAKGKAANKKKQAERRPRRKKDEAEADFSAQVREERVKAEEKYEEEMKAWNEKVAEYESQGKKVPKKLINAKPKHRTGASCDRCVKLRLSCDFDPRCCKNCREGPKGPLVCCNTDKNTNRTYRRGEVEIQAKELRGVIASKDRIIALLRDQIWKLENGNPQAGRQGYVEASAQTQPSPFPDHRTIMPASANSPGNAQRMITGPSMGQGTASYAQGPSGHHPRPSASMSPSPGNIPNMAAPIGPVGAPIPSTQLAGQQGMPPVGGYPMPNPYQVSPQNMYPPPDSQLPGYAPMAVKQQNNPYALSQMPTQGPYLQPNMQPRGVNQFHQDMRALYAQLQQHRMPLPYGQAPQDMQAQQALPSQVPGAVFSSTDDLYNEDVVSGPSTGNVEYLNSATGEPALGVNVPTDGSVQDPSPFRNEFDNVFEEVEQFTNAEDPSLAAEHTETGAAYTAGGTADTITQYHGEPQGNVYGGDIAPGPYGPSENVPSEYLAEPAAPADLTSEGLTHTEGLTHHEGQVSPAVLSVEEWALSQANRDNDDAQAEPAPEPQPADNDPTGPSLSYMTGAQLEDALVDPNLSTAEFNSLIGCYDQVGGPSVSDMDIDAMAAAIVSQVNGHGGAEEGGEQQVPSAGNSLAPGTVPDEWTSLAESILRDPALTAGFEFLNPEPAPVPADGLARDAGAVEVLANGGHIAEDIGGGDQQGTQPAEEPQVGDDKSDLHSLFGSDPVEEDPNAGPYMGPDGNGDGGETGQGAVAFIDDDDAHSLFSGVSDVPDEDLFLENHKRQRENAADGPEDRDRKRQRRW